MYSTALPPHVSLAALRHCGIAALHPSMKSNHMAWLLAALGQLLAASSADRVLALWRIGQANVLTSEHGRHEHALERALSHGGASEAGGPSCTDRVEAPDPPVLAVQARHGGKHAWTGMALARHPGLPANALLAFSKSDKCTSSVQLVWSANQPGTRHGSHFCAGPTEVST